MPLQTCRALKFPSGSSQNLLLCAGGALPLVLPECMLVLACAEEDLELPGLLFSPVWLHSCLSSSSRSSQGGAPLLSLLQLCSKKMLLCPMEEKAAEHFLLICHINCAVSEVGEKLSGSWKFPCLGLEG